VVKVAVKAVDDARVVAAIARAEGQTSGEIRVVVSRSPAPDAMAAARREFERLGMTATPERNGVLILVAPVSRSFAIIGDSGIDAKCGPAAWAEIARAMEARLSPDDITAALEEGIAAAGLQLAKYFPKTPGDPNSLPDTIERI
jgi:uncharacterized membrane protein